MALSVIVTSYESPETLRLCLESLAGQDQIAEIVVSDCSRINPADTLQRSFPGVRFLHFEQPRSVPELRWAAVPFTTADLIAITEARCVPSATWCLELLAAHALAPVCPAVGGTVELAQGSIAFDCALYLCEYGAYAPPVKEGPANRISGANLSYKRAALLKFAEAMDRGEWETLLHERWVRAGQRLWQSGATVTFRNSMLARQALQQRWHYGRGYAFDRVEGSGWFARIGFGIASLGLPLLLVGRTASDCAKKNCLSQFARAFGWVVALTFAWSWGETAGYLGGKPRGTRIF